MHLASNNEHLELTRLLVERGANFCSQNDRGETPLDRATGSGRLDIARVLIEKGAVVSVRDNFGWTPFHTASYSRHLHVVEFMLVERDIDIEIWNEKEQMPLYLAPSSGMLDVVRFPIEQGAGIHVNALGATTTGLQYILRHIMDICIIRSPMTQKYGDVTLPP